MNGLAFFFETWPDEGFERDIPIEYQDLTFRFENEEERFVVTMSLGVQEFSLKAVRKKEKELLILLDGVERFVITIEITFLPSFCIMVKEHFSGE
nr:hypothetical protein [Bacillus altitudinis]